MSARERVGSWDIIVTPPWNGTANMDFDRQTLASVEDAACAPTLRFFRWSELTYSYGRLQDQSLVMAAVPAGVPLVQRPTGGGIVKHDGDLCLSLAWRRGEPPLPLTLSEHYAWIHGVIKEALDVWQQVTTMSCADCRPSQADFAQRQCFSEPVAHDLLIQNQKVVGGALARRRHGFLYQGSVQGVFHPELERKIRQAFEARFASL